MITLEEAVKLGKYKITDGQLYLWDCFGRNARFLDFEYNDDFSYSIIFDSNNQTVYQAMICDYKNENFYRITHPDYHEVYLNEAESRGVKQNQVFDDMDYHDLDLVDDFVEKSTAILNGQEYDTRIKVELDMTDDDLYKLMLQAHENDMSLNDYVEFLLEIAITKAKQDGEI